MRPILSRPPGEGDLEAVVVKLGERLRQLDWRMATAESSTGGLIGHAITMVPGASDYYVGGVISYSNLAKEVQLQVPHELIEAYGAVSPEVAAAMAEGARERFGVELAVAVTGIAGPEGGSAGKPIGLHDVAAVRRGHEAVVEERVFTHDREGNRAAATLLALELALRVASAA